MIRRLPRGFSPSLGKQRVGSNNINIESTRPLLLHKSVPVQQNQRYASAWSSKVGRRHVGSSCIGAGIRSRICRRIPAASPSPLSRHHQRYFSSQHSRQANVVEIARFGLLSAFSLPFALWICAFSYDYVYRVEICQEALARVDEDLLEDNKRDDASEFIGREKELAEVSSLLDQEPCQIIVIAGGNEAGKSTFIRELLRPLTTANRGVTHVQLAQLVDSVNSFTQVFVKSFNLRWLKLRHALVDVLPFAGSEILVMKERYSDRDLAQALHIITEALKRHQRKSGSKEPLVIVIDGLGEGPQQWMNSAEGKRMIQRFLQWSIHVVKERRLAHIVLTGSEGLVVSLNDQHRITRGHVRVVGLDDLDLKDAAKIVLSELPDATDEEISRLTEVFGGFIHDLKGASRDIQLTLARKGKKAITVGSEERREAFDEVLKARFQQQVERVTAAFANAREDTLNKSHGKGGSAVSDDEEEGNPYLDPLKSIYSEAQATSQESDAEVEDDRASYTELQLWRTLQQLVDAPGNAVSFSDLRDNVFQGSKIPILELMSEDILSFEVDHSNDGWSWKVTPASPALGKAFARLLQIGELEAHLKQLEMAELQNAQKESLQCERMVLHSERKILELRKKSLLNTIELGKKIGQEHVARHRLAIAFREIVREEEIHDVHDCHLRDMLTSLAASETTRNTAIHSQTNRNGQPPLQSLLRSAALEIMSAEDVDDNLYPRLKKAFSAMDCTNDGKISSMDVVRVVKASTGHNVSLADVEQLVKEWDQDGDKSLDYNEFVRLLLSENKDKTTKE